MTSFGDVSDLIAGRPTVRTDPTYNRMATAYFEEVTTLRERVTGPPVVFLVRQFNEGTRNAEVLDSGNPSVVVPVGAGRVREGICATRKPDYLPDYP